MLAYVFWHWPKPDVPRHAYENALRAFHRAIASEPPDGFIRSQFFRLATAPWLPRAGYEDWYLIESFGALGVLNDAAVSGGRRLPHDAAAVAAAGGMAGVYRHLAGRLDAGETTASGWFSKPSGATYAEFFPLLERLASSDGTIWQRQMTLGPTPEFCIRSSKRPSLPPEWEAVVLDLG